MARGHKEADCGLGIFREGRVEVSRLIYCEISARILGVKL